MSKEKELVMRLMQQVSAGDKPVLKIRPIRGLDERLVRLDSYQTGKFIGVFVDEGQKETSIVLGVDVLLGKTILAEEVETVC